jgi:hypothetical protein
MPIKTGTGIIKSIVSLGNDRYRIIFEENSLSIVTNVTNGTTVLPNRTHASSVVALDPYVNIPNLTYSDFNAIINNDLVARQSNIFWDVDYSSNIIQAVNQQALISASQQEGNLPKAFIQDYNYYSTPIVTRNYSGTKNTVSLPSSTPYSHISRFNGGDNFTDQVSSGTFVGYFSEASASDNGGSAPYALTLTVDYLVSPDGTLFEMTNNDENVQLLEQNFVNNNIYQLAPVSSIGITQMTAAPFSETVTDEIMNFDRELRVITGSAKLKVTGARFNGSFNDTTKGGILYPAGIELTSAKDLPQQAREILANNNIIDRADTV